MTAKKKRNLLLVLTGLAVIAGGCLICFNQMSRRPRFRPYPVVEVRATPVTISGEVVDTWCYASQTMGPGKGPSHKPCALACAYGGVTLGILEDRTDKLYVAAKSSEPYQGCQELLIPYVGDHVTITGWLAERGGCRILKVKTVERSQKPAAPAR